MKKQSLSFFERVKKIIPIPNPLKLLTVFILLTEALYAQELPRWVQIGLAMQPVEIGVQVTFVTDNLNANQPGSAQFMLFEDMGHRLHFARDQQAARVKAAHFMRSLCRQYWSGWKVFRTNMVTAKNSREDWRAVFSPSSNTKYRTLQYYHQ